MEIFLIHYEWNDLCILNNDNMIFRKNINTEKGYYYYENNLLVVKWDNWEEKNYFIKYNDIYIDKNIKYEIQIENIFFENEIKIYVMISDDIVVINKSLNKSSNRYNYELKNNILVIKDKNNIIEYFYKNDDNYYELEYYLSKKNNISNDNNINDTSNLCNLNIENKNEEFINNKNIYTLIDNIFYSKDFLNKKDINSSKDYCFNFNYNYNKCENLFLNYSVYNKNYLDMNNFIKYKEKYVIDNKIISNEYFKIDIEKKFKPIKNKKRIVTLSEWGYPPFGGGENWLLNLSNIFHDLNYDVYIICFSDGFTSKKFNETNFIDLNYVKIIQMQYNLFDIIKYLKYINPCIINHQGIKRIEFMKIANILEIPFITGFCFWNNIIKQVYLNINILENNNIEKDNSFLYIEKYSYTYCSSDFVNDVIYKFFKKKINLIETISLKNDYFVEINKKNNKYVTLLNCHYNKGGFIIKNLLKNLNIDIPLLLVYTEYDDKINFSEIKTLLNERNNKNNINLLFEEKQNVKEIYEKTKIMLVPSLCDETFCRVAYEARMNNIPIISTSNGNLKYLLKNYAFFINDNNPIKWQESIEKLYYKINLVNKNSNKIINAYENKIRSSVKNIVLSANKSKYNFNLKNVAIIAPWADQGLGIQSRSYYNTLKSLGYNVYIFSFKPYHASEANNFLQVDKNEWNYENIYYSPNYRENIDPFEILNFIHDNNIKKLILIEASFEPIFKIMSLLKLCNIKIFLIINIECVRISEINNHLLFDKILCNNFNSYFIMNNLIQNKCNYLGFHLEDKFFNNYEKKNKDDKKLRFVCCGGLNSISRKNIDIIFEAFLELLKTCNYDIELYIYVQGVESSNKLDIDHPKIIKIFNNFSYKDNLLNISKNDIFIHCGGQEGLGLGFYEALYLGLPILTLDWTPNNEIIRNNYNGWLITSKIDRIYENQESLINRGIIDKNIFLERIKNIIFNLDNTITIINNTINNRNFFIKKNKKKFEERLNNFLSTIPNLD